VCVLNTYEDNDQHCECEVYVEIDVLMTHSDDMALVGQELGEKRSSEYKVRNCPDKHYSMGIGP
jgi:hypothetical protein